MNAGHFSTFKAVKCYCMITMAQESVSGKRKEIEGWILNDKGVFFEKS